QFASRSAPSSNPSITKFFEVLAPTLRRKADVPAYISIESKEASDNTKIDEEH
ncbi:hypothetical protein B5807_11598, partial [Epicoccum nigrum]